MAEREEELKSLLMRVKQNEKADLKLNIEKTKMMVYGPITSWQIDGETVETVTNFNFLGSKIIADRDCSHESKRCLLAHWQKKAMTNLDSIQKQRHPFAGQGPYSQSYDFSSSHVQRWELDHKERWVLKNWCFQTVLLETTLESLLDCKEIKPVDSKGNQPWLFIGRTDAGAEAPVFWPLDVKSWLIGKDPVTGKDWGQEEKEMAEDEMVVWHHHLNGHVFEQTPGDSEGQGSLACWKLWDRKLLDTT